MAKMNSSETPKKYEIQKSDKPRHIQDNKSYVFIPFPVDCDLNYSGDAWKVWGCLYLSHLLKRAFELSTHNTVCSDEIPENHESWKIKAHFISCMRKRGNYNTRREGQYWWKDVSEENVESNCNILKYIY